MTYTSKDLSQLLNMMKYPATRPTEPSITLHKATSLRNALTSLLTINPSWTSVKETPCEANKITST